MHCKCKQPFQFATLIKTYQWHYLMSGWMWSQGCEQEKYS